MEMCSERFSSPSIEKRNDLRRALLDALRRGHVDFVELLVEYGASLEKLTIGDMEQLYEIVDVRARHYLHSLICLEFVDRQRFTRGEQTEAHAR